MMTYRKSTAESGAWIIYDPANDRRTAGIAFSDRDAARFAASDAMADLLCQWVDLYRGHTREMHHSSDATRESCTICKAREVLARIEGTA